MHALIELKSIVKRKNEEEHSSPQALTQQDLGRGRTGTRPLRHSKEKETKGRRLAINCPLGLGALFRYRDDKQQNTR